MSIPILEIKYHFFIHFCLHKIYLLALELLNLFLHFCLHKILSPDIRITEFFSFCLHKMCLLTIESLNFSASVYTKYASWHWNHQVFFSNFISPSPSLSLWHLHYKIAFILLLFYSGINILLFHPRFPLTPK